MAIDALDIRMARLEGAFAQINERLGSLENRLVAEISGLKTEMSSEIGGLRAEMRSEITGLRVEMRSEIAGLRADHAELRRQMTTQFYWMLTFILGSILVPLLRDLVK